MGKLSDILNGNGGNFSDQWYAESKKMKMTEYTLEMADGMIHTQKFATDRSARFWAICVLVDLADAERDEVVHGVWRLDTVDDTQRHSLFFWASEEAMHGDEEDGANASCQLTFSTVHASL